MIIHILNIMECVLFALMCLSAISAAVFKVLSVYEDKKNADKLFVIIKKDGKVIMRKYMTIDEYNAKLSEISSYTDFHNYDIKKMTAYIAISGIAVMLLLVILMTGYDYILVKVLAGVFMLTFLMSGIALVKLKTENDNHK